jgi:hypothetical protein
MRVDFDDIVRGILILSLSAFVLACAFYVFMATIKWYW